MTPKQRRFVKMFQARFVPGMLAGTKTTTIRPHPTRPRDMPKPGDLLDARHWSGRPYGSPQVKILEVPIERVRTIQILEDEVRIVKPTGEEIESYGGSTPLGVRKLRSIALSDGFDSWPEMLQWFRETHQLPFTGILIYWDPEKMEVA